MIRWICVGAVITGGITAISAAGCGVRGVHPWDYCARFTLWMTAEQAWEWFEELERW